MAAPAPVRTTRSRSPTFCTSRRSRTSSCVEHLELDQRFGQRVVRRLDQRRPADAEVDGGRPALAAVERGRAVQGVEILVDVEVAMWHAKPAQMPQRASRVFAPVGTVNNDHESSEDAGGQAGRREVERSSGGASARAQPADSRRSRPGRRADSHGAAVAAALAAPLPTRTAEIACAPGKGTPERTEREEPAGAEQRPRQRLHACRAATRPAPRRASTRRWP